MVKIRQAQIEDAPILAEAERAIAAKPGLLASRPNELKTESFQAKIKLLSTIPNGKYIVAEDGIQVVGHALLDPMGLEAIEQSFASPSPFTQAMKSKASVKNYCRISLIGQERLRRLKK